MCKFNQTLGACALAQHDELGYLTAASDRDSLGIINGHLCSIPSFNDHLDRFCEVDKGRKLESSGKKHQRRYRFHDPLMQPFVIIRSLAEGIITVEHIKQSPAARWV
jgi:hypothetical protein